ncbi:hypothetical protein MASR2M44_08410 [Bacteroidota bacterium]
MKKAFVSNLILLMSVNLLIKPFWILGIDRGVQNHVGYVDYGIYLNLFNFSMLLITLLEMGINTYVSSTVARDPERLKAEFIPLTGFKLLSSLLYVGVTIALGLANGFDDYRIGLLFFLTINQILSYFYMYFRAIVGGLQLFKTDAFLSVIDRLLMIIFCGLMLWTSFLEMSISRFIYAQTFAYTIAVSITLAVLWKHLKGLRFGFKTPELVQVLKQMLPYALLSLLMTLYTRLDAVIMPKLIENGDYMNGIYASAYRLLDASNMMAAMVSMMLLPLFARMLATKENISGIVQFSGTIMILPALTLCMAAWLYQSEIMHQMNPKSTSYAAMVFGTVMFSFLGLASMYVFGTLLTAAAHLRTLNSLALVALVINLGLNGFLIPKYQALGAAIASATTQLFIGFSNFWFARKNLKLNFEKGFALKFMLAALLLVLGSLLIRNWISDWLIGILAIGSLLIFLLLSLKLINPAESSGLLKGLMDKRERK